MKRNIAIIAGIILLMASNSLFAQDKANKLLADLTKNIETHENMVVDFTYQITDNSTQDGEMNLGKVGKAFFKGDAYCIKMEDQHTISDGTTKWTYYPDDKEVLVSNITEGDISPLAFLSEIKEHGTAKLKDTDSEGNTTIEILESDGSATGFSIQFDKKGNVKKIVMDFDEEGRMILTIIETKYDQKLSPDQFTFNTATYPNVEVIDMR